MGERVCLKVSPGRFLPTQPSWDRWGQVISSSETGQHPDSPPTHRVDLTRLHKAGNQDAWGFNLTSAIASSMTLGK